MDENNKYDEAIVKLAYQRYNIIKSYYDWFGTNLNFELPKISYRNYLANNPLIFTGNFISNNSWNLIGNIYGNNSGPIDINGKKIGVLGDSLTQAYEAVIRECIEEMGGIPVCKGSKSSLGRNAYSQGYTLIVGASFASYAQNKKDWSDLENCDHIITELCTNDIAGSFSLTNLSSGMKNVASHLKGQVHALGIMPYAFSKLKGESMGGMDFSGVAKYAQEHSDEDTVKYIHQTQQETCTSLGWHFIDSHNLSCYDKWHSISDSIRSKNIGDGIHIAAQMPYKTWFSEILKNALGGVQQVNKSNFVDDSGNVKNGYRIDANGNVYQYIGNSNFSNYNNNENYGTAGMFSGKSRQEKLELCGITNNKMGPLEVSNAGLIEQCTFNQSNGQYTLPMNKNIHGDFKNICDEILKLGWFKLYVGNCYRTQNTVSNGMSRHCWGIAVDINPGNLGNPWFAETQNGRSKAIPKDFPEPQHGSQPPFPTKKVHYNGTYDRSKCIWHWGHPVVQIFLKHGWGWGGAYGDVMHFSVDDGH